MLTEEQQAQLDALLEKLEKDGVDYDTMKAEYDKLENSFKEVEEVDEVEKTDDSQSKGANVDQKNVVAPEDSDSPSFLENIKSSLDSTLNKYKFSNPLVSEKVEKERKRKETESKGKDEFYVDSDSNEIDFSKLDDVDFNTFKDSLVINDKGEYLGLDGKPYEKVLDAYQSAIYAKEGLDFKNISQFEKDIQEAEVFFNNNIMSKENIFTRTGKGGQRIDVKKDDVFNPDYTPTDEELSNPNLAKFFNEDGTVKSEEEVDTIMEDAKKYEGFLGGKYQEIKEIADNKLKGFLNEQAKPQVDDLQDAIGDTIKGLNEQLQVYNVNFTDKTMSSEDNFSRTMENVKVDINNQYSELNNRLKELTGYTFDNFDKAIDEAKTPEEKQNLQDLSSLYSSLNEYAKPYVKVANDSAVLNRYSQELNSTLTTMGLIMGYDDVSNIRGEYIDNATSSVVNNAVIGWNSGQMNEEFWQMVYGVNSLADEEGMKKPAERIALLQAKNNGMLSSRVWERYNNAKTFAEQRQLLAANPVEIFTTLFGSSMSQFFSTGTELFIPIVGASTGTGAVVGGAAGALTGAGYGLMGWQAITGFNMELGNAYSSTFQKAGLDLTNPDDVIKGMQDPDLVAKANELGVKRGVPIALANILGAKAAGAFVSPLASASKQIGLGLVSQTVVEPVFEGAGELGAQVWSGEGIVIPEIVNEMIGGQFGTASNLSLKIAKANMYSESVKKATQLQNLNNVINGNHSVKDLTRFVKRLRVDDRITEEEGKKIITNGEILASTKEALSNVKVSKTVTQRVADLLSTKRFIQSNDAFNKIGGDKIKQIDAEIDFLKESNSLKSEDKVTTITDYQRNQKNSLIGGLNFLKTLGVDSDIELVMIDDNLNPTLPEEYESQRNKIIKKLKGGANAYITAYKPGKKQSIFVSQQTIDKNANLQLVQDSAAAASVSVAHEVLHAVLDRTMTNDQVIGLSDKLTGYLNEQKENDGKNISAGVVDKINSRLNNYKVNRDKVLNNKNSSQKAKDEANANYAQEVFTNISDEISLGNINWNRQDKPFWQRVANDLTDFYKYKLGMGDDVINAANIETGEQAFEFLKNYNKTFFKGKLGSVVTPDAIAPTEQGAERESIVEKNKKLSEALKNATPQEATDIKNDLFLNNQGIVNDFVKDKFKGGLGINREEFKAAVQEEVLVRLNTTYNPTKGEYGAYIREALYGGGKFGGGRLGNILKSLGQDGELFTSEIDDNKMANTPEPTPTATSQDKPQIDLARRLRLNDKERLKVISAVVKTLGTRLPSMDQKAFKKELEKSFSNELKKPLADLMGTRKSYTRFLSDPQVKRTIVQKLPITTLVRMERLVKPENRIFTKEIQRNLKPKAVDKAIAEGKLGKDTGRTTGPTLYAKKMPTKEQFLEFFDIAGSKKGTRKDKLAENLGAELAFDQTMDVLMNNEVAKQRFEGIQALTNNDLKENYIAIIAKQIERDNPDNDTRASEVFATAIDLGIAQEDLTAVLQSETLAQDYPSLNNVFENAVNDVLDAEGINNKGFLARLTKDFKDNETLNSYLTNKEYSLGKKINGVLITNKDRQNRAFDVANELLDYFPAEEMQAAENVSNKNQNWLSKVIYKDNGSDRGLMFYTDQTEKEQIDASKTIKGTIIIQKGFEAVIPSLQEKQKIILNKTRSSAYKSNLIIQKTKIAKAIKNDKFNKLQNEKTKINGKNRISDSTKQRWKKFGKLKKDLEVSNKTANKLGHIINIASNIANEELTGKQKAAKLRKIIGNDGIKALKAGHALMEAVHSSWNDWVDHQVNTGKMTRDEAVKDVITNLQLTTNSVFSARAYAAFTSFYFTDGAQNIPKNLQGYKGEHVYDASNLTSAIVKSIANNTFNQDIEGILDGFEQSFIPTKLADTLDDLGGRNNRLKNLRFLLDPEIGKNTYSVLTNETMYEVAVREFTEQMLEDTGVKVNIEEQTRESSTPQMSKDFNKILEQTKGVGIFDIYSDKRSKAIGAKKGRFSFFIPPSAEDFVGLIYSFLDKGKVGEKQMEFFKENLIKPFGQAMQALNLAQNVTRNLYNDTRKEYKDIHKLLKKETNFQGFTYEDAARVYMWTLAGYDIPGLNRNDIKKLVDIVNSNERLKDYSKKISSITGTEQGYVAPGENWDAGSILNDMQQESKDLKRKEFLSQWIENKNAIFSKENLNKIEAIYGSNFRESLEDMLYRMENGTNRNFGTNRLVNNFMNWINNSVGAIMFFNARSAVLQTISALNYVNLTDNNPIAVAKTLLNQKQYWTDFVELFNSDFLKSRRSGLKTDVNASEIANYVKGSKNKVKAGISYLLSKGFLPTQMADSFAIAIGGASMVRNRINALKKQGMSEAEAKAQALLDWQELTEEAQQSSRADRISSQQAGPLGRVILAFANTPMQYARLMKKATLDLVNRRGDWKTNLSKIMYYGAVQNFAFNAMQQALFALMWDEDDDEEPNRDKMIGIGNGMADSLLRGMGVGGAGVAAAKNIIIEAIRQSKKKRPDYEVAALKALSLSPPISSKINKLRSAALTYQYNKEEIMEMGLSLDNPAYLAVGKITSATTNLPLDRVIQKYNNLDVAMDNQTETWQSIALVLGWDQWSLGLDPYAKYKKPKSTKSKSKYGSSKYGKSKYKSKSKY